MKRFSIPILALLFLVAGVAWALESCLHLHSHFHLSGSLGSEPHRGHESPFSDSDSADRLDADPLCSYRHAKTDPGVSAALTPVGLITQGVAFARSAAPVMFAFGETRDLGLGAVFRRAPSFSALNGLPHHLFFSVLRI